MWHNRHSKNQRMLCFDCSRPRCTAQQCKTCPVCRDPECKKRKCANKIVPLNSNKAIMEGDLLPLMHMEIIGRDPRKYYEDLDVLYPTGPSAEHVLSDKLCSTSILEQVCNSKFWRETFWRGASQSVHPSSSVSICPHHSSSG